MHKHEMDMILEKASPDAKPIIEAIWKANRVDEIKIIDDILKDVNIRRLKLFDLIKVDLSVDRSVTPLSISGGGTYLAAFSATSTTAELSVSFEEPESNSDRRFTLVQGRRLRVPYTKLYIYHSAQSGAEMFLMRAYSLPSLPLGVEDDSSQTDLSDLAGALGLSSALGASQVTVGITATLIKASNTSRKRITIKVPQSAANPVYIDDENTVTTTTGHELSPGDAITIHTTAAIYGIASASTTVTVLEET